MMRLVSEVKNVKQPVRYGFRIGDCVWVRRTLITSRSLHFVDARIELEHINVGESVSVYTQCRSQLATEFSSTDVALRYCKRIAIVQGAFKMCEISNWNQTQSNQLFTIYKFLFRWLQPWIHWYFAFEIDLRQFYYQNVLKSLLKVDSFSKIQFFGILHEPSRISSYYFQSVFICCIPICLHIFHKLSRRPPCMCEP